MRNISVASFIISSLIGIVRNKSSLKLFPAGTSTLCDVRGKSTPAGVPSAREREGGREGGSSQINMIHRLTPLMFNRHKHDTAKHYA